MINDYFDILPFEMKDFDLVNLFDDEEVEDQDQNKTSQHNSIIKNNPDLKTQNKSIIDPPIVNQNTNKFHYCWNLDSTIFVWIDYFIYEININQFER